MEGHAQSPGACGKRDFVGGPEFEGLFIGLAEQQNKSDETSATDDVRAGGTPRIREEMVFGGQNLTQHRIQAVEEHLRHAPQGERGGQGYHLVIVATHVQAGKQRAGRRHHHGHGQ